MIAFDHVTFAYPHSEFRLEVPSLRVAAREKVAVIGPSGSGKTTLLHLAAGIITPLSGSVRVEGQEISRQSDATRRSFRIRHIGLVFQEFELLEYLTVRENILLPYRINPALRLDREVRQSVQALAASVSIADALNRFPHRLSHGERQRVAISRALVAKPRLILADEPTGNLDPRTSQTILSLLLDQADRTGATLLMVTHDHSLLRRLDRVLNMEELTVQAPNVATGQASGGR
jgi:putative ABC transport system ATP-binding protein